MLTEYISTAIKRATYEIFSDGTFYGEIPGFQGVYANEKTLEVCREQLQEILEEWIILGLRLGHSLPVVNVEDIRENLYDYGEIIDVQWTTGCKKTEYIKIP